MKRCLFETLVFSLSLPFLTHKPGRMLIPVLASPRDLREEHIMRVLERISRKGFKDEWSLE